MKHLTKILFLCFLISPLMSQIKNTSYSIEFNGIGGAGNSSPFWFQNNRFGQISETPIHGQMHLSVTKTIDENSKIFDFGFGAEMLARVGQDYTDLYPHQYYIEGKLWMLDMVIGAKEQYFGPSDPALSSGGLLISSNSRPIPKLTAGIFEYTSVPFTKGFAEIKGFLSHGWFNDNIFGKGILLHHKHFQLQLGGKFPFTASWGLDHVAQWGGDVPGNGQVKINLENYKKIFFGKSGGEDASISDQINVLGNHIISQNITFDLKLEHWKARLFWQNMNEDGPIRLPWLSRNWRDGLWGAYIRNDIFRFVGGISYEYMSTLDQSGPWHDKDGIVFGGGDSYFTNVMDWAYFSRTIGTPLILSPTYNSNGSERIVYNDLKAHHLGIDGDINGFNYRLLATFSRYYPQMTEPFRDQQFWLLEVKKKIKKWNNLEMGVSLAHDEGKMVGYNTGLMISVCKSGLLDKSFRK